MNRKKKVEYNPQSKGENKPMLGEGGLLFHSPNRITSCPHCGSGDGFYTKRKVCGWAYHDFTFDGKVDEGVPQGLSTDSLSDGKLYKNVFCRTCRKPIKSIKPAFA